MDALRADVLESKIKNAIEDEIDIDAFNTEVEEQNDEFDLLNTIKERITVFVATNLLT